MKLLAVLLLTTWVVVEGHPSHLEKDECHHFHPNHHKEHKEECCKNMPTIVKPEKFKKVVDECRHELGMPSRPPPPPPPPSDDDDSDHDHHHGPQSHSLKFDCLGECVFKKLDLLDEENKIKEDYLKKLTKEGASGEWEKMSEGILQKCIEYAAEGIDEKSKCKSGSEQIIKCLGRSLFLECPKENWSESDSCKEMKAHMEKCPFAPPPPMGKHDDFDPEDTDKR